MLSGQAIKKIIMVSPKTMALLLLHADKDNVLRMRPFADLFSLLSVITECR